MQPKVETTYLNSIFDEELSTFEDVGDPEDVALVVRPVTPRKNAA